MHEEGPVALTRPVEAIEIPYGTRVMLPAGAPVRITQSLGGSYTVLTEDGYLVRIADRDADALGRAPAGSAAGASAPPAEVHSAADLEKLVWQQLETLYDPEIPVNVVELGLIYGCTVKEVEAGYRVEVQMTLTAPGCGMGDVLRAEAESKIQALPAVREVAVEMVVDPPWDPSRMSDAARLQLNMM
jgi:probable FeS assembly SUF system protein SufT